ncbi:C-type lectin domain family 12 member B-like [Odontesthes bonariensis]
MNRKAQRNPNISLPEDRKFPSSSQSFLPLAACWLILLVIITLRIYFTSITSENNTKLTLENQQLTVQMNNLTQASDVSENKITNLEGERKNLAEQVQTMEAKQVEFNVSRAQWSIDAYCPKKNNARTCNQCERGWVKITSSCYAIHDAKPNKRRSWEGAREDCRGKGSDLVVVGDNPEKTSVNKEIWGTSGFWIGLKAENGKWKWVDGSDLADK